MELLIDYLIFFSLAFVPTLLFFFGTYIYAREKAWSSSVAIVSDSELTLLSQNLKDYKKDLAHLNVRFRKTLFQMFLFTAALCSIPYIYEMSQQ